MNRREFIAKGGIAAGATVSYAGYNVVVKTPEGRFERLRREGRRRILRLPPDVVETILGGWARGFETLSLPVLANLPADIILEGISWNFFDRYFLLCLWHESFDPVPDGAETPPLEKGGMEYIVYEKISDHYKPVK